MENDRPYRECYTGVSLRDLGTATSRAHLGG